LGNGKFTEWERGEKGSGAVASCKKGAGVGKKRRQGPKEKEDNPRRYSWHPKGLFKTIPNIGRTY